MLPFIQEAIGLQKEGLLRDQTPDERFKNPFSTADGKGGE
jgi:hypothetical protein